MKFKIIDKEKHGFARYCPTFAKGYETIREDIRNLKIKRLDKKFETDDAEVWRKAVWALWNIDVKENDKINRLVKMFYHEKEGVRKIVAWKLIFAAEKGADISVAIPLLVKTCLDPNFKDADMALERLLMFKKTKEATFNILKNALGDKSSGIRAKALSSLDHAVEHGMFAGLEIPLLIRLLEEKNTNIRLTAAVALNRAAEKGTDITMAIPALVKALGYRDRNILYFVSSALEKNIEKDHENRAAITKRIMSLTNSDWMMREAEKNSDTFIQTIKAIDRITRKIDSLEKQAA